MWGYTGWKAVGFPSIPHSTQFKISTPLTLHCLHNCNTGPLGGRGYQWKESKVFTCWIFPLLWTRLRARGCHWYKVWTFPRMRPGHGKAPGGTVSEKILLQPCDWSVDLKLWWKRAERLLSGNCQLKCYIRVPLWKCITFLHAAHFNPLQSPTAAMLRKYIKRWVWFVCIWVWFPMSPPFLSSSVETRLLLFSQSPPPPRSLSNLSVTSHSCPLRHPRTRHTETISTQGGKAETCCLFFFISKCFTFAMKINVWCEATFKCKVHELHWLKEI